MIPMMGLFSQAIQPKEDGSLNGYKVENLLIDTDEADRTIMLIMMQYLTLCSGMGSRYNVGKR